MQTDEIFEKLRECGIPYQADRVRMDNYGDSDELSQELIALILAGQKRANASLVWSYEHEHESVPSVEPYSAAAREHAATEGES